MSRTELAHRAQDYANRKGLVVGKELGHGVHGSVFVLENHPKGGRTAIKAFAREKDYCQERDVYFRLAERAITQMREAIFMAFIQLQENESNGPHLTALGWQRQSLS